MVHNFNRCFTKVCEGKQLALNQPNNQDNLKILEMNPGALGEFSMWLGSLIGGANREQQDLAGKLGNVIAVNVSSNNQAFLPFNHLDCDQSRKQEFRQWLTSQDEK